MKSLLRNGCSPCACAAALGAVCARTTGVARESAASVTMPQNRVCIDQTFIVNKLLFEVQICESTAIIVTAPHHGCTTAVRLARGPSTVDQQRMAGNQRSRRGGEEDHRARNLRRLSDAMQRGDALLDVCLEGGIAQR